jgi:hypothetical protein
MQINSQYVIVGLLFYIYIKTLIWSLVKELYYDDRLICQSRTIFQIHACVSLYAWVEPRPNKFGPELIQILFDIFRGYFITKLNFLGVSLR